VKLAWLALLLALSAPADAKKKKPSSAAPSVTKKQDDKPPPPGDKRLNEGAQGRQNATEDAAKAADSPQFERRP
jgi:hypothetical protein